MTEIDINLIHGDSALLDYSTFFKAISENVVSSDTLFERQFQSEHYCYIWAMVTHLFLFL